MSEEAQQRLSKRPVRQSIQPTYDSRETGPRFYVTSEINGRVVGAFRQRIEDPFVRQTVHVCLLDLLRGLFRRRLTVTVLIGGDPDIVDDVLELDANTLIPNSTRREQFNKDLNKALVRTSKEAEAADEEVR